jgi:superfamily II DNA or RNA helicase
MDGFIYIRTNKSYDLYSACKLGITENIPNRNSNYITGEIERGIFAIVLKIRFINIDYGRPLLLKIEKLLQNEFEHLNIKMGGGREFYDKCIINMVEPCLNKWKISYKSLSQDEINNLIRSNEIVREEKEENMQIDISGDIIPYILNLEHHAPKNVHEKNHFIPRADQEEIINKSIEYYKNNDKGMLILTCGVGKTLISLWITQKLGSNHIIIGVPNLELLKQWENVIKIIFHNVPYLCVKSGITDKEIPSFMENNKNGKYIIITTYASSYKIHSITNLNKEYKFDMKILDEAHHLTTFKMYSDPDKKIFVQMLNIPAVKQIALTATLKNISSEFKYNNIVSNDSLEYFGEIIDRKDLLFAINKKVICDYVIHTIIGDEYQISKSLLKLDISSETDKRLALSALTALKSICECHSHHILIYSNNKENASKLVKYIQMLLEDSYFIIDGLFYSDYHSDLNSSQRNLILSKFENAKFGIITCVYCLSEGWDFPLLDAVLFAEYMSSEIRIVQSALRANRKNKLQANKIAKIILPIFNIEIEGADFKKIKEVIYQMGLEDETVMQKLYVHRINMDDKKQKIEIKENIRDTTLGEFDEELTKKLKLKITERNMFGLTYTKAKEILAAKNITSKAQYYELCSTNLKLPQKPEEFFEGQFISWIDYLSIKRVYYDLETCKLKVSEYLRNNTKLKKQYLNLDFVINEVYMQDKLFPHSDIWIDYYKVKDLSDIISIGNNKKKNGINI